MYVNIQNFRPCCFKAEGDTSDHNVVVVVLVK
jgi:hypothetical protein